MNWRSLCVLRESATHIVCGVDKNNYYGIIAYAGCEFNAFRIKKALLKEGAKEIQIYPIDNKSFSKIENKIEFYFFNKSR